MQRPGRAITFYLIDAGSRYFIVSYSFIVTANGSSMKRCYFIFIEWLKAVLVGEGGRPRCHVMQTQCWGLPTTWEDIAESRECVGVLQPIWFQKAWVYGTSIQKGKKIRIFEWKRTFWWYMSRHNGFQDVVIMKDKLSVKNVSHLTGVCPVVPGVMDETVRNFKRWDDQ